MIKRNKLGQFEKGSHWRQPKPYYNRETMVDLYVNQGKSTSEIAKMFGVTDEAILHWMRKHKIDRRSVSEARKIKYWGASGKDNPMYGHYGAESSNYKGGIAPERQTMYSHSDWKLLKSEVLSRANGACERCGEKHSRLQIHHIKPLKNGGDILCEKEMLAVLCPKCHGFVHSKRNEKHEYLQ